MDKSKLLKVYGKCYNNGDFGNIEPLLSNNVKYEAFDCMYSVATVPGVKKVLTDSLRGGTGAYEGFYFRKGIILEKLIECVIICNDENLKSIRIVDVKPKRGRIFSITGFDPAEHMHTRGKRIVG